MNAQPSQTLTLDDLRRIALALPGVEEGKSYGTSSFRVRTKMLARIKEDNETLVMKIEETERDFLLEAEPDVYYITDHYRGWPYILIHLSKIDPADLARHFEQAWRHLASKSMVAEYDKKHNS